MAFRRGRRKKFEFSSSNEELPPIISAPIKWLEKNALSQEGIFRLSGTVSNIRALKKDLSRGKTTKLETEPCEYSTHDVANVLKQAFRDLEDPLLTEELRDCFLAGTGIGHREARMNSIKQVLGLLPVGNKAALKQLMGLLLKVHKNEDKNRMDAKNLAIIFSPTLLRCPAESIEDVALYTSRSKKLIATMIKYYEQLFEGKELPPEKKDKEKGEEDQLKQFNKTIKKATLKIATTKLREEREEMEGVAEGDEEGEEPDPEILEEVTDEKLNKVWNSASGSGSAYAKQRKTVLRNDLFKPLEEIQEEKARDGKEEEDSNQDIQSKKPLSKPNRKPPPPPGRKKHGRMLTEEARGLASRSEKRQNRRAVNQRDIKGMAKKSRDHTRPRRSSDTTDNRANTPPKLNRAISVPNKNRVKKNPGETRDQMFERLTKKYLDRITDGESITSLRKDLEQVEGLSLEDIIDFLCKLHDAVNSEL